MTWMGNKTRYWWKMLLMTLCWWKYADRIDVFPGPRSNCSSRVCSALTRTSTPSRSTWGTSSCRSGWAVTYLFLSSFAPCRRPLHPPWCRPQWSSVPQHCHGVSSKKWAVWWQCFALEGVVGWSQLEDMFGCCHSCVTWTPAGTSSARSCVHVVVLRR